MIGVAGHGVGYGFMLTNDDVELGVVEPLL